MTVSEAPGRKPVVVRTYGRGGSLGLLSPILAYFMSSQGMRGWQEAAARAMEDDAVQMAREGYLIDTSEELTLAPFGITYYRVRYRLAEPPVGSPPR